MSIHPVVDVFERRRSGDMPAGGGPQSGKVYLSDGIVRRLFGPGKTNGSDPAACGKAGTGVKLDSAVSVTLDLSQPYYFRVGPFDRTDTDGSFRIQVKGEDELCVPIKAKNGNVAMICL